MAKTFIPSPQQSAIFAFVENPRGGSAIVEAVAGAGKTTTLVKACERMNGQVALIAYNTKMAKELREKTSHMNNIWAKTFHSFGMNALQFRFKNGPMRLQDPTDKKVRNLIDAFIAEKGRADLNDLAATVAKTVSMAKQRGIGICFPDTDTEWLTMIGHFDLANDLPETAEDRMDAVIKMSRIMLRRSTEQAQNFGVIDFDDMIYLPLIWNMRLKRFPWVLVDEAQDTNPTRREMAKRMLEMGGRLIAVGDPCQPVGTMVVKADGSSAPIEKLVEGDKVRSFARRDSAFVQGGRTITGITVRPYNGKLAVVSSMGKTTKYTPNHYCYARLKNIANKYCVYLMRKGDLWRVGTSLMQNGKGVCGPMSRKRLERADDVWILRTFDTEREAKTEEFRIATEEGVPELLFRAPGSVNGEYWEKTQLSIDLAWASLDKWLLAIRAKTVLSKHDRMVEYPLNETASKPGEFWVTRPIKIRAANLMDGMEVLHYSGMSHYSRDDFAPIKVSSEGYNGPVYSMNVEKDHSYIGDGIATFNCQAIYGFSGADNDSLDQIRRDFNATTLPLTVTYRCPKTVVDVARRYVHHITAHESAPDGMFTEQPYELLVDQLVAGDAVLCRYTKYLVSLCFRLIRVGKPARIEGRTIGAGLVALARKWKVKNLDTLVERIKGWEEREVAKATEKKDDRKVIEIGDKAETMYVLIDRAMEQGIRDVDGLCRMVTDLFDDDVADKKGMITLCSVHRSKGLEFPRVFVLGLDELMGRECAQSWQTEQEINLQYVAVTRAQELLVNVVGVKEEKRQHTFKEGE